MTETTEPQTPTIVDKPKRLRKQTVAIVAGALVVVAALGWGAFATWQKSVDENARTSALDSGRQFATDLATYNFQNLDQNLSVVRDNSVGEFAGQYAQVAANLQNMIVQYQATSSAQIISAGLASSDRDKRRGARVPRSDDHEHQLPRSENRPQPDATFAGPRGRRVETEQRAVVVTRRSGVKDSRVGDCR